MKPKTVHFQTTLSNHNSAMEYEAWLQSGTYVSDNTIKLDALKKVMGLVIENELTQEQGNMLELYFFQEKTMTEIAQELDLNKSTVSKNIKRGLNNLRKYLKYCDIALSIVPIDIYD